MKRKRDLLKEWFLIFLDLYECSIFLIYDLSKLLRKLVVTVPNVQVTATPPQPDIGDTVTIEGVVNSDKTTPAPAGTPVSIVVTDSPGTAQPAITVSTDANGAFTAAFVIPQGFATGPADVKATALGVTGSATFTRNNKITLIELPT